jgi:hypothetical protein
MHPSAHRPRASLEQRGSLPDDGSTRPQGAGEGSTTCSPRCGEDLHALEDADRGRTYPTVANVSVAVGAVFAAVAAAILMTR